MHVSRWLRVFVAPRPAGRLRNGQGGCCSGGNESSGGDSEDGAAEEDPNWAGCLQPSALKKSMPRKNGCWPRSLELCSVTAAVVGIQIQTLTEDMTTRPHEVPATLGAGLAELLFQKQKVVQHALMIEWKCGKNISGKTVQVCNVCMQLSILQLGIDPQYICFFSRCFARNNLAVYPNHETDNIINPWSRAVLDTTIVSISLCSESEVGCFPTLKHATLLWDVLMTSLHGTDQRLLCFRAEVSYPSTQIFSG